MDYTIAGQLTRPGNEEPLPEPIVEAAYLRADNAIKTDRTLSVTKGRFKFTLSADLLLEDGPDAPVSVQFNVYRGEQLLPSDGGIKRSHAKNYHIRITVYEPEQEQTCRVSGTITRSNSNAAFAAAGRRPPFLYHSSAFILRQNCPDCENRLSP